MIMVPGPLAIAIWVCALAPGPVSVKLGPDLLKSMNLTPPVHAGNVDFGEFHEN